MTGFVGLWREAVAVARSQPVASALTAIIIAGMVASVMLTTGRAVAAEQQVLDSIDSTGTRSVTVRADPDAGLFSDVLQRLAMVEGIEWVGALGPAVDAANSAVGDGVKVSTRYVYADDLNPLGIPARLPDGIGAAFASEEAIEQLGLSDGVGSVTRTSGDSYTVAGAISSDEYLGALGPVVLIPRPRADGTDPVSLLVIVATRPELVAPVAETVSSVLGADPTKVTVQTSETLAQLRAVVQGQLAAFSRGLVLMLLGVCGGLVAVLQWGLVLMRRKDFGRRRALGATRLGIIALVTAQTTLLSVVGVTLGIVLATVVLLVSSAPLPGLSFTMAVAILAALTATGAGLLPGYLASRRDPIQELRVP